MSGDGNPNSVGADVEFVGRDLRQRRLDALADLHLAGPHRDGLIGLEANPRVDGRRRRQARRRCFIRRGLAREPSHGPRPRQAAVCAIAIATEAHGTKHAPVSAATAEVAVQRDADGVVARAGLGVEQGLRAHDEAGGTVTALGGIDIEERALEGMEIALAAQALERRDLLAGGLGDGNRAGLDGRSVDDHRTRAALAKPTSVLCGREPEVVPEDDKKGGGFGRAHRHGLAIHDQGELKIHWAYLARITTAARFERPRRARALLPHRVRGQGSENPRRDRGSTSECSPKRPLTPRAVRCMRRRHCGQR